MFRIVRHHLMVVLALMATLLLVAAQADAAPRISGGSRGSRTFSAPPPTATAPNSARPIERSITQPGRPATPTGGAGGFFNRPGLLGGLAGGFLGAGLFGLLFGHGFFGGLGGFASLLGLVLQLGLLFFVGSLIWRWWQSRSQPAAAFAGRPMAREIPLNGAGAYGSAPGGGAALPPFGNAALEIKPEDFNAFEQTLGDVLTAYGAEDVAALRAHMTPEMLSYYAEELAKNSSRGVVNHISDVKLLQGDLAEAWREGDDDYATVAMHYSMIDRTVDRRDERLVEGSTTPQEATEIWTFRRTHGGHWILSAVQQPA